MVMMAERQGTALRGAVSQALGPPRTLGTWAATAMVVNQVVGVGIFLTPAAMLHALGSPWAVLALWAAMAALAFAGALYYAELATRFPRVGGGYVYLREAFGRRWAFVYGWITILVIDPALIGALAIGLARYALVALGLPDTLLVPVAMAGLAAFSGLTLIGAKVSVRLVRWTAAAKLLIVGVLVCAGLLRAGDAPWPATLAPGPWHELAASTMAAFFAFGGWWELGRMSEEIRAPHRTIPRALLGGIGLVAVIYSLVSLAFVLAASGPTATDQAFVSAVGAALFGAAAERLLAAMVVVAVAGTLTSVLLAAPRVCLAMARDGMAPPSLARVNTRRDTSPAITLLQLVLATGLIAVNNFDDLLGYFVPPLVFFVAFIASAVLVLPRPPDGTRVFRPPLHPLPLVLFLLLVTGILVVSALNRPVHAAVGAAMIGIAALVSRHAVPPLAASPAAAAPPATAAPPARGLLTRVGVDRVLWTGLEISSEMRATAEALGGAQPLRAIDAIHVVSARPSSSGAGDGLAQPAADRDDRP
jgi:APA family basic amino acid/polyamine antiporter